MSTMYEFRDLNPTARGEPIFVPDEAMLLDGEPIEVKIPGYQTLNVSGRELLARSLTTQDTTGSKIAKRYVSSNFEPREITVKYKLHADDSLQYRMMYEELNVLLNAQPEFEASFADEPDYGWLVTLTGADAPDPGSNEVTGSFTLTAPNPFKHRLQPLVSTGGSITIREWLPYETVPEYFEASDFGLTSKVDIKVASYIISLTGDFKAGDVLRVQPKADDKVLLNGEPNAGLLTLDSDLENVAVKQGDIVTIEPGGTITMALRGERA